MTIITIERAYQGFGSGGIWSTARIDGEPIPQERIKAERLKDKNQFVSTYEVDVELMPGETLKAAHGDSIGGRRTFYELEYTAP